MMRISLAAGVFVPALAVAAPGHATSLPACRAVQLSPSLEEADGVPDDARRADILLVLRNLGPDACRMPGLPLLRFEDVQRRPLPATRRAPPGMHPGPVVLPVEVAAGARLAAVLRWDPAAGTCVAGTVLAVAAGGGMVRLALPTSLCGPLGAGGTFTQTPLRPDSAPP